MEAALYDKIGKGYSATRRADPRLAASISKALGDARTVVNVGAGAGAYEPQGRSVVAGEPSAVMIAQGPASAAHAVQAHAEALPLPQRQLRRRGGCPQGPPLARPAARIAELRRVARRRVVLFNADPAAADLFWLTVEYLPGFLELIPGRYRAAGAWRGELEGALGPVRLVAAPIPHDCADGFYGAFWRRPDAYLDAHVRAGISVFAALAADEVDRAVRALDGDLRSGAWNANHQHLLDLSEHHLGYYIVIAELS